MVTDKYREIAGRKIVWLLIAAFAEGCGIGK